MKPLRTLLGRVTGTVTGLVIPPWVKWAAAAVIVVVIIAAL